MPKRRQGFLFILTNSCIMVCKLVLVQDMKCITLLVVLTYPSIHIWIQKCPSSGAYAQAKKPKTCLVLAPVRTGT